MTVGKYISGINLEERIQTIILVALFISGSYSSHLHLKEDVSDSKWERRDKALPEQQAPSEEMPFKPHADIYFSKAATGLLFKIKLPHIHRPTSL